MVGRSAKSSGTANEGTERLESKRRRSTFVLVEIVRVLLVEFLKTLDALRYPVVRRRHCTRRLVRGQGVSERNTNPSPSIETETDRGRVREINVGRSKVRVLPVCLFFILQPPFPFVRGARFDDDTFGRGLRVQ